MDKETFERIKEEVIEEALKKHFPFELLSNFKIWGILSPQ